MSTTCEVSLLLRRGQKLTGLRIPGTAALAIMADQMIQFGAVRWLSKIVGLLVSFEHLILLQLDGIRVSIRRYNRNIQGSSCTFVRLFERERAISEEHCLPVSG
jgi:hypothetical protein